jgi:hypothetical protein
MRQLEEMADAVGQCLRMLRMHVADALKTPFLLKAIGKRQADIFRKCWTIPQDFAKLISAYLTGDDRCERDDAAGLLRPDQ